MELVSPLVIFLLFPFTLVLQHPLCCSVVMNIDLCSNCKMLSHKYRNTTACIITNSSAFNVLIYYITFLSWACFVLFVLYKCTKIRTVRNTATVSACAQSTSSPSRRIYLVAQVCKYETQRHYTQH